MFGDGKLTQRFAPLRISSTVTLSRGERPSVPPTTTDSSVVVNLQCSTCSAGGGRFAVQSAGTDVFKISPNGGAALFQNSSNSTTAFRIQNVDAAPVLSFGNQEAGTVTPATQAVIRRFEGTAGQRILFDGKRFESPGSLYSPNLEQVGVSGTLCRRAGGSGAGLNRIMALPSRSTEARTDRGRAVTGATD